MQSQNCTPDYNPESNVQKSAVKLTSLIHSCWFEQRKRHRYELCPSADLHGNRSQKLLICIDARTAKFVPGTDYGTCVRQQPGDRLCDVFDVDRLQPRLAP